MKVNPPPSSSDYLKQVYAQAAEKNTGAGSDIFNLTEVEKRRAQLSPEGNGMSR